MKKKVIQSIILLSVFSLLLAFIQFYHFGGLTGFVISSQDFNKVDPEIIGEFDDNDVVEVIVGLSDEIDFPDISQEFVSGGFVADVSKKELIDLIKEDSVDFIEPVRKFNIALDDSNIILKSNSVWPLQFSGINITGNTETVCVIDTGIDYSHPSLKTKNISACNMNCINQVCVEDCNITDLNGHGTHVSGIAAAQGEVLGIGKGANLVGMKVFPGSSGGGATTTGIKNAIDWCVENTEEYNISVISMSLGTVSVYDDYCDGSYPSFSNSINNAFDKNISVVVASGNSGSGVSRSNTSISSPACIQNAIPISATNKDDSFASFGHYSSYLDIFTPGSNIYSTCINSGYCTKSGTSMSAPMASGALSLINGYLRISDRTKTVNEIKVILNSTGKKITDGEKNFTRLDIFEAILSFDNIKPEVFLISPSDGRVNVNQSEIFSCNSTDWKLSNISLKIWNSNGSLYRDEFSSVSGISNETSFKISDFDFGSYTWNCLSSDNRGNLQYSTSNRSITVGGVSVSLRNPEMNFNTNLSNVNFVCDAKSEESYQLENITFYLWNSSNVLLNTSIIDLSDFNTNYYYYSLNHTFNYDDEYQWNCESYNNASNSSNSYSNFGLDYDTEKPEINLMSIPNNSEYDSNLKSLSFDFNVSDRNTVSCNLFANNKNKGNVNATNTEIQTFTQSFTPGNYLWKISCKDLAGNSENSEVRTFNVNVVSSSSSGRGSSGSSSGSGSTKSTISKSTNQNAVNENDNKNQIDESNEDSDERQTSEEEDAEFVVSDFDEDSIENSGIGITGAVVSPIENRVIRTLGIVILLFVTLFVVVLLIHRKMKMGTKIHVKNELKHSLK